MWKLLVANLVIFSPLFFISCVGSYANGSLVFFCLFQLMKTKPVLIDVDMECVILGCCPDISLTEKVMTLATPNCYRLECIEMKNEKFEISGIK